MSNHISPEETLSICDEIRQERLAKAREYALEVEARAQAKKYIPDESWLEEKRGDGLLQNVTPPAERIGHHRI